MGKWAPASGRLDDFPWSWGECSVVLGAMQRVKVPRKVMT